MGGPMPARRDPDTGKIIGGIGSKDQIEQQVLDQEIKTLRAREAKREANKALGLDERGLPLRPEFQGLLDRDAGRLEEQFQIGDFDKVDLDRRALDRITEEGLAEGPSRGAQRQLDLQSLQQGQAFDDLRRGEAGAQQQAFDALASQGGLSGGARERLARSGQRNTLLGRQQVRGQGAQQRLGILAQDEGAKRQLLGQAQQGAQAAGQFGQANRQFEAQRRQFDITNALQEEQNRRQAELSAFEADRKASAAEKSAAAQARASCFAEGTLLPMADGTYKKIEDVNIDDSLKMGGVIHSIIKSRISNATPIYNYEGVLVTGSHAVLEDNKWIRVCDSRTAKLFKGKVEFVYNIANECHLIEVACVVFSDYEETDDFSRSDEDSLNYINDKLNEFIEARKNNVSLC